MTRSLRYFLAMLLPLSILLALPAMPRLVLLLGQEIRLNTVPADPRDPFLGDYVTLRFEAEELPISLLRDESLAADASDREKRELFMNHNEWFVTLQEADGLWRPESLKRSRPKEGVYLKGHQTYNRSKTSVGLSYGPAMKRFYLKEGTGRELEKAARQGRLEAIIKVWRGLPVLVSLDIIS